MNKSTNLGAPTRATRHFVVYQGSDIAMQLEDRAGNLLSTAPPPPSGPVQHPFVHAQALRASSEHPLRQVLDRSKDFDGFIHGLVDAGFDVYSYDMAERPYRLENRRRIYKGAKLVGAFCDAAGQFTTLEAQPEAGQLVSSEVSMTVYDLPATADMLKIFQDGGGFNAVLQSLEKAGFEVKE